MSSQDKAQAGFELIKEAVMENLLAAGPAKVSEIGKALGIYDSYRKSHPGYVVWTALGALMKEGKVEHDKASKRYSPVKQG